MGALLLLFAMSANAAPEVMGFQSWKASRIDDAKSILEKLQQDHAPAASAKRPEPTKVASAGTTASKAPRADAKLQQAQMSLDVAHELTVNDYFVLYLSQFKTREAFLEAAKKLTPEESADLMISYQKHLVSGAGSFDDLAPSAAGLAAPAGAGNKAGSL